MNDAEKIRILRFALAPFADLLENPAQLGNEPIELTIFPNDVLVAKQALIDTEDSAAQQ